MKIIKDWLPDVHNDVYVKAGYEFEYDPPQWVTDTSKQGGYVQTGCYVRTDYSSSTGTYIYVKFSDFEIVPLIPGDKDHYISDTIDNAPPIEGVEVTKDLALRNESNESPTIERSLGSTYTEGISTSLTHTSGYSFSENLEYTNEFKAGIFGIGTKSQLKVGIAFQQPFTNAETNTESKTETNNDGSKTTVSLKPYTTVVLNVRDTDLTTVTRYNCPIGLSYTVTVIVEETGMGVGGGSFTFGDESSNAISNLNKRAFVDGQERFDPQEIDWVERLKDSMTKDAIQKITTHIPMSAMGATTSYKNKTTLYTVNELAPIYPLRYVALTNVSDMQKSLKVGGTFYADSISLSCYNFKDGSYYKFVPYGTWVVTDENGTEITDGSGAVVLETIATSGQTKCKAVRAGTGYIKFKIDEKSYPNEIINSETYVSNADLSRTAVIEVNVTGDEQDDPAVQFEIDGDYIGAVNAASEQIEGDDEDHLQVLVMDSTGKEISASYEWDAKEREEKGIKLTKDGMISFTQPGRFHVRVITPNKQYFSDWKTINAEVFGNDSRGGVEYEDYAIIPGTEYAEANTVIEITGDYIGGVNNEPELLEGAGKLRVRGYDATGKEIAIIYEWETDSKEGMTLTANGTASFKQAGLYHARVRSGEYVSDWVTIKANDYAPARFVSRPTATKNTYDGKAHELLNDDAVYEGGFRLMYGLGTNETEPTEYNSYIPETPANNPGNSSGGCEVGFGFAGLILLGMILKRK